MGRTRIDGPLTAEDLLRPGNPYPKHSELWDGTLFAAEPSGGFAGFVGTSLAIALGRHVADRRLGQVFGSSQGFFVARAPDRVLAPDVAFLSYASLPTLPWRGFIERAPDFVAEVRSPEDSARALHAKAGVWIGHRVPVVWAVDPLERSVTVYRPGEEPADVREPGFVDARPAVPSFALSLVELFADVPRRGPDVPRRGP